MAKRSSRIASLATTLPADRRVAVIGFLAAVALALAVDVPLQRAVDSGRPPGVVRDYFNATETFGNGFGVAMIVLAVVVLDPVRRVQAGRLLAASLGAGIAADVVKLFVGRNRPHGVDLADASVLETFTGWAPLATNSSVGQSFPSAHTATAAGLAAALAITYPAGARLFVGFAVGVAMQRVFVGAHYLSDVIVGATLGGLWGVGCCHAGLLCRGFDRFEAWWSRRFGWPLPTGHPASAQEGDALADPEPETIRLPTALPIKAGSAEPTPARRAA